MSDEDASTLEEFLARYKLLDDEDRMRFREQTGLLREQWKQRRKIPHTE